MELIIGYLHSGFSAIVPFIILLGLLIFVHELGHFLVAKYYGVRVEVFSLGFGKKIFKYKRGDTTYCISLIPLGGYVKMFGDEVGADIPEEDRKASFTHKPVGQRIAVVLAGPLMNLFFAIFIFGVVAMIGEEVKAPIVGEVVHESQAAQLGFTSGDQILAVNDKPLQTWEEFQDSLNKATVGSIKIKVKKAFSDTETEISVQPKFVPNSNILSLYDVAGEIEGLRGASMSAMVGVVSKSKAATAGFKTGDQITKWGDHEIKYLRELKHYYTQTKGAVEVEIKRLKDPTNEKNPEVITEKVTANIENEAMNEFGLESSDLYLAKVIKDSPADKAGLKAGDKLVALNGKPLHYWEEVLNEIKSFSGQGTVRFDVNRDGQMVSLEITPQITEQTTLQGAQEKRFTVGIFPMMLFGPTETVLIKTVNPFGALWRGAEKSAQITAMTVVSFLRLIQGIISPKNIGGIISIGQAASETFKMGASYFLTMMGIISINLFILNLLPIPVLDGGHLLFYTVEALRGAPLSMRKMEIAQQVGLVLLMSLMVFALFNDVNRIIGQ